MSQVSTVASQAMADYFFFRCKALQSHQSKAENTPHTREGKLNNDPQVTSHLTGTKHTEAILLHQIVLHEITQFVVTGVENNNGMLWDVFHLLDTNTEDL